VEAALIPDKCTCGQSNSFARTGAGNYRCPSCLAVYDKQGKAIGHGMACRQGAKPLCRWPRCECAVDLVYATDIHIPRRR
jgi:hypothetical protein